MNKKNTTEILKAMMYAAGLSPDFDEDYYENITLASVADFLNGVQRYFKVDHTHYLFSVHNLGYMDTPSQTINMLVSNLADMKEWCP